jgi:HPt (histidine-containing phosphotransfer) domain-containing protein
MVLQRWVQPATAVVAPVADDVEPWLADAYMQQEAGLRRQLHAALLAGDPARVAFISHKLKGSAASVGGTRVVDLCAQLERQAEQGSLDGLDGLVEDLESAASMVRDALGPVANPRSN